MIVNQPVEYSPLIRAIKNDLNLGRHVITPGDFSFISLIRPRGWFKKPLAEVMDGKVIMYDPDFLKVIAPAIKRWEKATGEMVTVVLPTKHVEVK